MSVKKKDSKIDFDAIKNPIVKKALLLRRGSFMFNYGDESEGEHTDRKKHKEYNDAWKYKDHIDHTERYKDHSDYSEWREHSDQWRPMD